MKLYIYPPTPISVSVPPIEFILDGTSTSVSMDTATPSNSKPLPVINLDSNGNVTNPLTDAELRASPIQTGLNIIKEGVLSAVSDNSTPSEVVAVPVKIMAVDGTNINITAGDINIQTTDIGSSFDSLRVGDGSGNYIGVNASQEALVHDADALAELQTISAVDFATSALQTEISGKLDLMVMDLSEAAQDLMLIQADTASSLTVQNNILAAVGDVATETTLAALAASFSAEDFATETTLVALEAKFGTLGQKASAGSAPVVLSTEQEQLLTDLNTTLTDVKNFLDLINASTTGRVLDSVVNVTATTSNSPAPAGAKGFIIQNSVVSDGAVRFTNQGGGASVTDGFYLGVGQSTSYIDGAANLALFDVDGTGFDAAIIWFT